MKVINLNDSKNVFFKVLDQTKLSQIAVVSLQPNQTTGKPEAHNGDQIVYIIEGAGVIQIDKEEYPVQSQTALIIPANANHQIKNTGPDLLFIFTVYTPPEY